MAGTECLISKKMVSQLPLNHWYLNEGVAWVDEAAALAGIPSGSRSDGLKVRIGLVDYEFKADLTTLQAVAYANDQTAEEVTLADAGSLYTDPGSGKNVEAALAEVKAQANATDVALALVPSVITTYRISLTNQSSVAARVAGATETTDYPTGWTLAANATVNLLVTHTLTGRKLSSVNVFEIDGANERLLKPFESAYSGVLCNGLTVLIEGLAPVALALRIELIFN